MDRRLIAPAPDDVPAPSVGTGVTQVIPTSPVSLLVVCRGRRSRPIRRAGGESSPGARDLARADADRTSS